MNGGMRERKRGTENKKERMQSTFCFHCCCCCLVIYIYNDLLFPLCRLNSNVLVEADFLLVYCQPTHQGVEYKLLTRRLIKFRLNACAYTVSLSSVRCQKVGWKTLNTRSRICLRTGSLDLNFLLLKKSASWDAHAARRYLAFSSSSLCAGSLSLR